MIYLKTEVWSSLTDETEWRSNMYLHDNIESLVWHGVEHLVECEPGVVHNVVNFSPFSTWYKENDVVGLNEWV